MPYSRVEKKFSVLNSFKTYGRYTPSTSQISMQSFVVLRCLAAEKCCLKILKIQQRGDPRVIFRSVQKLNFFRNHLILLQISCTFHIRKPFDAAEHGSLTMNYSTQATFGLKKHAIQQGCQKFFVSKSFETYGGLTPLTSRISIPSFVVLQCPAAAQRCLKVLKIQQRGYPREIFRSA